MAQDATRLPEGIIISTTDLATARPVGTIIYYTPDNIFAISTDAIVATYDQIGVGGVLDSLFRVEDSVDPTKRGSFQLSSVTPGALREITWPDWNLNLNQAGIIPPNVIADPGTAQAIPVTKSGFCSLTIGAGAETNTLALFPSIGQTITFRAGSVAGGTRAITAAGPLNLAGNTIMTFNAVGDSITLYCYGPGYIILQNESVVLS